MMDNVWIRVIVVVGVVLCIVLLVGLLVVYVLGSRDSLSLQQAHSRLQSRSELPSLFHTLKGIIFGVRRRKLVQTTSGQEALVQVVVADFGFRAEELRAFQSLCGSRQHTARLLFPHVLGIQMVTAIATNPYFPVSLVGALHLRSYFEVLSVDEVDCWLASADHSDGSTASSKWSFRCSYLGMVPGTKRGSEFLLSLELFDKEKGEVLWREYVVLFSNQTCKTADSTAEQLLQSLNQQFDFKNIEQSVTKGVVQIKTAETWDFALLSGDINPIHVSAFAAKLLGQKSRIAHGAMVVGKALSAVQGPHQSLSSMAVSFKGPTLSKAEVNVTASSTEGDGVVTLDLVCKGSNRPSICLRFG